MAPAPLIQSLDGAAAPDRALLGGKGASLVELLGVGAPVPPGFVITTAACERFFELGELPPELIEQLPQAMAAIERQLGRRFGDAADPLLVSVRSGAPVSMPGMMDTILNVGLAPGTLPGFVAAMDGDASFAEDCRSRLQAMFERSVGARLPEDPMAQLLGSVEAVFSSWNSKRARLYRRFHKLEDTGTAVVIQAMVFGNRDQRSGTGVVFTRDPSSGERRLFGDFLANAQGEDIVAGSHNTSDLSGMAEALPEAMAELAGLAERVEAHFADLCEIEFTVESGRLWLLQARPGQRSARAEIVAAVELAETGAIDRAEAVRRVDRERLQGMLRPVLDEAALDAGTVLTVATGVSPGVASGRLAFDAESCVSLAEAGEAAIMVRPETSPDDLEGIIACTGLLTLRGGKTSHAAVVTRGLGRPCVCGASELQLDAGEPSLRGGGTVLRPGERISIDGASGRVIVGSAPVREPVPPPQLDTFLRWLEEDA